MSGGGRKTPHRKFRSYCSGEGDHAASHLLAGWSHWTSSTMEGAWFVLVRGVYLPSLLKYFCQPICVFMVCLCHQHAVPHNMLLTRDLISESSSQQQIWCLCKFTNLTTCPCPRNSLEGAVKPATGVVVPRGQGDQSCFIGHCMDLRPHCSNRRNQSLDSGGLPSPLSYYLILGVDCSPAVLWVSS